MSRVQKFLQFLFRPIAHFTRPRLSPHPNNRNRSNRSKQANRSNIRMMKPFHLTARTIRGTDCWKRDECLHAPTCPLFITCGQVGRLSTKGSEHAHHDQL